mgnify:CR=1 FL=1
MFLLMLPRDILGYGGVYLKSLDPDKKGTIYSAPGCWQRVYILLWLDLFFVFYKNVWI